MPLIDSILISLSAGIIDAAARSSSELNEALRRLPEIPTTVIIVFSLARLQDTAKETEPADPEKHYRAIKTASYLHAGEIVMQHQHRVFDDPCNFCLIRPCR
jgi:hypothetical protein